jgi:2-oxoglutarate ferredoxin oxidoreductase subunit alpha
MNTGQLAHELRARYLVDIRSHATVEGRPLYAGEVEQAILEAMAA